MDLCGQISKKLGKKFEPRELSTTVWARNKLKIVFAEAFYVKILTRKIGTAKFATRLQSRVLSARGMISRGRVSKQKKLNTLNHLY